MKITAASRVKDSSDFPSNQSFSAHARHISKATCLVLGLKVPFGLPFT